MGHAIEVKEVVGTAGALTMIGKQKNDVLILPKLIMPKPIMPKIIMSELITPKNFKPLVPIKYLSMSAQSCSVSLDTSTTAVTLTTQTLEQYHLENGGLTCDYICAGTSPPPLPAV